MPRSTSLVLVAEDDDDIRAAIVDLLEFRGYRVVEARDGREALELAFQLHPAVVLLDHCMPEVAGADVLVQLVKSNHDFELVLMSAVADLHGLARAVGARHVLPKPFSGEQLLGLVGALMVDAASS